MAHRTSLIDEDEAEARALAMAIAESDADPRLIPHDKVRTWLLRLASGEFDAAAPELDPYGAECL